MPPVTETELNELKEVVLSLREEMRLGFLETRAEIKRVEFELKGDIKQVESELKSDIKQVESELKSDIKQVEFELKGEIQRVEAKFEVAVTDLKGDIRVLEERTKLGFWGFVWRGVIIGIIGLLASSIFNVLPEIIKKALSVAG